MDSTVDREEAVIGVSEDKVIRRDFGREIVLDLSTPQLEYKNLMYPLTQIFDCDNWQDGFDEAWPGD